MRKKLLFTAFVLLSIVINAQTWTQQNTNMTGTSIGVDQISAIDSNTVWVNGFNGSGTTTRAKVCSRTQNGGLTWSPGTYNGFGATVYPQVLCGVTYNKAFAVAMDTAAGGYASFWKTTNGGANWSLVTGVMNNASTTFADGVMFWDTINGFCYGDPVNNKFDIYYTNDGGTTWTPTLAANLAVPLSGEYGYNGFECTSKFQGGYAAFVTNMGRVYKTSNYGINWTVTTSAPFTAIGTGKIYLTGINKMIVAGMLTGATTYTWKQTIDGGATWTTYSPTGTFYNYAMTYVPNSDNMVVSTAPYTTSKGVSYSTDGGASFTDFTDAILQPTVGTNIQCLGVGFSDATHGWVGNYGSLNNSILKVVINLPSAAGSISGPATVCQGQNSVTYSVPSISNATSYLWTLPAGVIGSSTLSSITVNYGANAVSGNISVKGHNTFGNGLVSNFPVMVNPLPSAAGIIFGDSSVCQGENAVSYSINTVSNTTTYVWTLPTGSTGNSSTNSITVNYSNSSVSGNITVKGNNSCGSGLISTKAIIVNPIPGTPVVTQNANTLTSSSAAGNQWYNSVTGVINNATSQTYNPMVIGNYFVIVTLNGCSSDSSNILHYDNTGIGSDLKSEKYFSINPNPSNGIVNFSMSGNNEVNLKIIDITGSVISDQTLQIKGVAKSSFDFSSFSKGIYFIKYTSGNDIVIKKLIIN